MCMYMKLTRCVCFCFAEGEDGVFASLCVSMIKEGRFICSAFGQGATSLSGKGFFCGVSRWWWCV